MYKSRAIVSDRGRQYKREKYKLKRVEERARDDNNNPPPLSFVYPCRFRGSPRAYI